MKKVVAAVGVLVALAVVIGALVSGKPNESPKQHPETTPPSQNSQPIDPKSVGGPADPRPR